jgi:dTDP-4-amino-4,6-dideoxygalactose transaminase
MSLKRQAAIGPTKNLGAMGDGGMIVARDAEAADQVSRLRNYGLDQDGRALLSGDNSRLDEIQAAILRVGMRTLDENNALRRRLAARYREGLGDLPVRFQKDDEGHVYHLFAVRHPERARFREALQELGVGSAVHYAHPVHFHPAYAAFADGPGSFPNSEAWARETVSLPLSPGLAEADVDRVIEAVRSVWR